MSNYLIASDFDGTLCFWPNTIHDEDREAIRRFREAGNRFVIVTGRSYSTAYEVFNTTSFHDMDCYICMSGAYCAKPDGTEVFDKRVSGKRLGDIFSFFRDTGARYAAMDVGQMSYGVEIGGEVQLQNTISLAEASAFETFTSLNAGYKDEETTYKYAAELGRLFGDTITPLQNKIAIDMPPAGINKAVGAQYAAELYGIDKDNVYTVGDSYNDIAMVSAFHGRAIDSCPDELAQAAEKKIHRIREIVDEIMGRE